MTNPPGNHPPPPPPGGPYGDDEGREEGQQPGQEPYGQQPGQEPYGQQPGQEDPYAQPGQQGGYGPPDQASQGPYGQQAAWGQPGAYGQPGYPAGPGGYGMNPEQDNKLGVWALVTGILGFCCGPLGIVAIILGKKSKDAAARGTATNGGLGQAGFILGIIVVVLWVLGFIFNITTGGFNTTEF